MIKSRMRAPRIAQQYLNVILVDWKPSGNSLMGRYQWDEEDQGKRERGVGKLASGIAEQG
jgi:hypothetical protein